MANRRSQPIREPLLIRLANLPSLQPSRQHPPRPLTLPIRLANRPSRLLRIRPLPIRLALIRAPHLEPLRVLFLLQPKQIRLALPLENRLLLRRKRLIRSARQNRLRAPLLGLFRAPLLELLRPKVAAADWAPCSALSARRCPMGPLRVRPLQAALLLGAQRQLQRLRLRRLLHRLLLLPIRLEEGLIRLAALGPIRLAPRR